MTSHGLEPIPTLTGNIVRLEPLSSAHVEPLHEASSGDRESYRWSFVPNGLTEARRYVENALSRQEDGLVVPFAIARVADKRIIGSTRFFNLEYWEWPQEHPRYGNSAPDAVEIGYSWLAGDALGTGANIEAKKMLLTFAFEQWGVLRVCFHTDIRNDRSRAALAALGAQFEGFLRWHRIAVDSMPPRTSARFSIIQPDWAEVKLRLLARLKRHQGAQKRMKG